MGKYRIGLRYFWIKLGDVIKPFMNPVIDRWYLDIVQCLCFGDKTQSLPPSPEMWEMRPAQDRPGSQIAIELTRIDLICLYSCNTFKQGSNATFWIVRLMWRWSITNFFCLPLASHEWAAIISARSVQQLAQRRGNLRFGRTFKVWSWCHGGQLG
jgi:hypothetical protein